MGGLELGRCDVHLWFIFYNEIRDEKLLGRYWAVLSVEERERYRRFHFAKDRHRYLNTWAAVRTVLSRYPDVASDAWSSFNEFGCPRIARPQHAGTSFNVSHTDGLILLGVTSAPELGVDTENVSRTCAPMEIA